MALTKRDRVLTITDDAQEAEKLRFCLAAAVVETGVQAEQGVYVKPFQSAGSRTSRAAELRAALAAGGAAVRELGDGRLEITGAAVEDVATLAAARGLPIFEISEETGNLEEAFLMLTAGERRPG